MHFQLFADAAAKVDVVVDSFCVQKLDDIFIADFGTVWPDQGKRMEATEVEVK